jgi:predicted ester cyclase
MSTAEVTTNKATFRRFRDAMNTCDMEFISKTIDELVEPDAMIRTPLPGDATGAQALKQVWAVLLAAFPDLQLTVEDLIGEGDKVVARIVVTGTHLGQYMGMEPTGKSIAYDEIFIFGFVDGRVAQTWGVVDVYAQMKQLGVVPAELWPGAS